jgi:hypothetical protein
MKQNLTYQSQTAPMGGYPFASDAADYGCGTGMFKQKPY